MVDIFHCSRDANPRPGVLCEYGIAGLEEDLDSIKGCNDGLGLCQMVSGQCAPIAAQQLLTAHPAIPPATPDLQT